MMTWKKETKLCITDGQTNTCRPSVRWMAEGEWGDNVERHFIC